MFRSRDISELKEYLERTWLKIMEQHVNVADLIIAKEVKHKNYKVKPAAVYVDERNKEIDPMLAAKHK